MQVKLLEIRDKATFFPVVCVNMNPDRTAGFVEWNQTYLLRRCGYPCDGRPNILYTKAMGDGNPATNDPYHFGDRTNTTALNYIIDHWNELKDGDVIDVEFILGETKEKKISEKHYQEHT